MIAALIIATGKTSRKDSFEPLKEVGTIPVIERIVWVFQRAGIERIAMVYDGEAIKPEDIAAHMNVDYLCGRKDADMLDNVKLGLSYLQDKCASALITHVNVPLFTVDTVRALMAADGALCVPSHNGRAGHPLHLSSSHFQAILSYSGDEGLAGAVKAAGLRRVFVDVPDEGVLFDVQDVPDVQKDEQYWHLLNEHSLRTPYPDARIRLVMEEPFYGPGSQKLVKLTKETGSLREACRNMGLSYGKGRMMVANMERRLGYPVIVCKQGNRKGARNGGYSIVTEKGEELMKQYESFIGDVKRYMYKIFPKYFNT